MGAYIIQFLTTTLYKFNVDSTALPAYKAVVVIILVVLSAPVVREKINQHKKSSSKKSVKEAA
jgi:simple sugar transport system permease protein